MKITDKPAVAFVVKQEEKDVKKESYNVGYYQIIKTPSLDFLFFLFENHSQIGSNAHNFPTD